MRTLSTKLYALNISYASSANAANEASRERPGAVLLATKSEASSFSTKTNIAALTQKAQNKLGLSQSG